jgi:GNAT superfamily N-acetyltransferase
MSFVIERAERGDETQLKSLWRSTFGDADEYIEGFLSHMYTPEKTAVCRLDGKIVSAAYVLNMGKFLGETVGVTYAFSTLPEYRSRGIGKAIAEKAKNIALEDGVSALCPAENSLFRYYEDKCGYDSFFYVHEFSGKASGTGDFNRLSSDEYMSVRENLLGDTPHIVLTKKAVEYQRLISESTGGGLFALTDGTVCGAVEVYKDKFAVIKELLLNGNNREKTAENLAGFLGCNSYFARTPAVNYSDGRAFAMIYPKTEKIFSCPPWFGFAYD